MTAEASAAARAEFSAILNADPEATLEKLRDGQGRIVLNADDLFRQYPPYENDFNARKVLGPVLYPVAREFTDQAFRQLLAAPVDQNRTVVFTAGGGASGKSTVLRAQSNRSGVEFVVDTTFSTPERALSQVAAALEAGRNVEINYVYRPFEDCVRGMLVRALNPAVGRIVAIDDLARTHWGSQQAVIKVLFAYFAQTRVEIRLWENVGVNQVQSTSLTAFRQRLHPTVDELQVRGQVVLDAIYDNKDREWNQGQIPAALYEAASSKTRQSQTGRKG